jgi:hypothetical protein
MKAQKISFKTKDGRDVMFKKKGNGAKAQKTIKMMEKRLSAMEKAVMQYNAAVRKREEKSKEEKKVKKVVDLTALVKPKVGVKKKAIEVGSDSD